MPQQTTRPRDAKGRFLKRSRASVPVVRHVAPPSFVTSWKLFAAVLGIAIAWYYAAPFIVLGSVIAAPFVLLRWLEPRYPRTAWFLCFVLMGVIDGLFRRCGRRRW